MTTPLPTGTLTFLFTDIEGSTARWEHQGAAMSAALVRHNALLRTAIEAHGGHVFKTVGDAFCSAFADPVAALSAALDGQLALATEDWGAFGTDFAELRVRMGLHTGRAEVHSADYFGPAINRTARLMSIGHGGQVLLSLATQQLVRDHLPATVTLRDLGEHRLRDLTSPERVFQLAVADQPSNFPPLTSLGLRPHNLPIQLTSFVGREREVQAVQGLLQQWRLVTLTGIGGTGKTRLALQVAAEVLDAYPDGTWFVDLSPLSDGGLVPQTIATVLSLREQPGRTIEQVLLDHVRDKQLLILLDNCEHLVTACAELTERLLRSATDVTILATSRESLRVQGEAVWTAPPLTTPDLATVAEIDPDGLGAYEAVRLFVERALAVKPTFAVTRANAPAVAGICHHLEGIPLAIELAAARVRLLTPEDIRVRLDDRLRLLAGGARTAPARQQTLQAALEWSHDLLMPGEQILFRRLAVFRGGWLLESAETVCVGEDLPGYESWEVLDLLTQLVDKSLVVIQEVPGATMRYRLLETVREYALQLLAAADEGPAVSRRHLAYVLELAGQAETGLRGPAQGDWMARLDMERENVRSAVAWSASHTPYTVEGLQVIARLHRYMANGGQCSDGLALVEPVLSAAGEDIDPAARAGALNTAGILHKCTGAYEMAREDLNEALSLYRAADRQAGASQVLHNLGVVHVAQGSLSDARSCLAESLAIKRTCGDLWGAAASQLVLGVVEQHAGELVTARQLFVDALEDAHAVGDLMLEALCHDNLGTAMWLLGDVAGARRQFERSLGMSRASGNVDGVYNSLNNLGVVLESEGDIPGARAAYAECLAMSTDGGNRPGIVVSLQNLAGLAFTEGALEEALGGYREALTLSHTLGMKRNVAMVFSKVAEVLVAMGRPVSAVCLAGALEALLEGAEFGLQADFRLSLSTAMDSARATLGDAAFAAAMADGRAMSLDEAVSYAMSCEQDDG